METATIIYLVLAIFVGVALGIFINYFYSNLIFSSKIKKANSYSKDIIDSAKKDVELLLHKAKVKADNLMEKKTLQAKTKILELRDKFDKELVVKQKRLGQREKNLNYQKNRLEKEYAIANTRTRELKELKVSYRDRLRSINVRQKELDKKYLRHIEELEKISGITSHEAKEKLISELVDEANQDAIKLTQNILHEAELSAINEAKKIVIQTIQRVGAEHAIENSVTVFNIESDEIKGRIIGREGRNIRAFESATGVELIVDDTPEAIIISCFDPVRREIARISLHRLTTDGRIHPAKIEEVVNKITKQMEEEIIEIGKRTITELNISKMHPKLVAIIGRMKYRSSYGQNLLQHSKEVARLCSIMASELGLNPKIAKRAGLLHDIGKVPESESETPHALLGMQWAQKYGETSEVCNAIGAHHDEIEMTYLISPIVQVCDAISGARPGARKQVLDSYLKRLMDLEELALSFDGVNKCYAIQAGRELRVLVESEKVNDAQAKRLSFEISQKIQKEMTYPGQVRVTVIRELRSVSIAK